jgi:hypothetical protein
MKMTYFSQRPKQIRKGSNLNDILRAEYEQQYSIINININIDTSENYLHESIYVNKTRCPGNL